MLQLAEAAALEGADHRIDHGIVHGVEGVDDGSGQGAAAFQGPQQAGQLGGAARIADGIKAGIRSEGAEHGGIEVALGAEMQLHHHVALVQGLAEEEQQMGFIALGLQGGDGFALARLLQHGFGVAFRAGRVGNGVQAVVGGAAAQGLEAV